MQWVKHCPMCFRCVISASPHPSQAGRQAGKPWCHLQPAAWETEKQGVSNLPQIRPLVGSRSDCGPESLDSRTDPSRKSVLSPPSTTSLMANVIPPRAPSGLAMGASRGAGVVMTVTLVLGILGAYRDQGNHTVMEERCGYGKEGLCQPQKLGDVPEFCCSSVVQSRPTLL